jgi:hypothetical protein
MEDFNGAVEIYGLDSTILVHKIYKLASNNFVSNPSLNMI